MSQEQSGEISCLDSEQIRALVLGEIPPGRITQFEKHLASCGFCRERLEKESGDPSWMEKVRASLTHPIDANEENNASPASANPPDPVLSLLDSSTHPDSLGKIKDYEILGVLGRGGMGAVLRAFDPGLNRFVALKILSPHLAANATARKRFLREARAAAAIAHENVIAIHGVSEFKGIPYLVMPLIRGDSLQKRMRENGPLELEEILRIGLQTASGLAAAHSQGLIHRDVKPANILLGPGTERVTLTDFGLARTVDEVDLTQTGMLAGTPRYMSPEQTRGENLDTRSDLFSLGTVLFEMVTGHAPFRGQTTFTLMKSITESHHKPVRDLRPDCPEWLERIIHRLLAKNPIDRFASARDVQALLTQGIAHLRSPKTEMAPATAGFVLPSKDAGAMANLPPSSPPLSSVGRSLRNSLTPFQFVIAGLFLLLLAGITIPFVLDVPPKERLAIIAILLSPINLGIIFYAAYRIYLVMFGNSRSKDIGAQNRSGSLPGSPSELDGIKSIRESTLPIYYYFGGFFVLFLTSMASMSFVSPYRSLSFPFYLFLWFPFYLFLSILIILYSLLFIYFIYLKKSYLPTWKKTLQIPVLLSLILTPLLMVFILDDKFGKIYASRDGYLATLANRVSTLGQQHPDRQQITAAQTLLMGSGGHQLRAPIGIWYFLIGVAILLGLSGLVLVFRKQSTKRAMVYWAGSLGGVVLVFLILTEWAHQAAIAEMALICNQTFPRENSTLKTYDMSNEVIPSPEPLVRGGGLIAPSVPGNPGVSPYGYPLFPPSILPEAKSTPPSSYQPAKPFTIKPLGVMPSTGPQTYLGFEIMVPPEQLISFGYYQETPESKRILSFVDGGGQNQAFGFVLNTSKEPKRAIWKIEKLREGKRSQHARLSTRIYWADQPDLQFPPPLHNNAQVGHYYLANLEYPSTPEITRPGSDPVLWRIEWKGKESLNDGLKSHGGQATEFVQFESIPMPLNYQIGKNGNSPGNSSPMSMVQPETNLPAIASGPKPRVKILGMGKYWEYFSGFAIPRSEDWAQLTIYSTERIKVLSSLADLEQSVQTLSANGFSGKTRITLVFDPKLISRKSVEDLQEKLIAKGYSKVLIQELSKTSAGIGEMLLSYPPGRGEEFLKILEPKLQAWNNQQKEKFPKDPVGTLAPLGQTGLLEAKGSYRFLKMLITVFDKAKDSKPGKPLFDLTLPITELPTTPPSQPGTKEETNKPEASASRPAKESPAKEPAPKDTSLKEPLKKDAPSENALKLENSPKLDSPAKDTPANREPLKK